MLPGTIDVALAGRARQARRDTERVGRSPTASLHHPLTIWRVARRLRRCLVAVLRPNRLAGQVRRTAPLGDACLPNDVTTAGTDPPFAGRITLARRLGRVACAATRCVGCDTCIGRASRIVVAVAPDAGIGETAVGLSDPVTGPRRISAIGVIRRIIAVDAPPLDNLATTFRRPPATRFVLGSASRLIVDLGTLDTRIGAARISGPGLDVAVDRDRCPFRGGETASDHSAPVARRRQPLTPVPGATLLHRRNRPTDRSRSIRPGIDNRAGIADVRIRVVTAASRGVSTTGTDTDDDRQHDHRKAEEECHPRQPSGIRVLFAIDHALRRPIGDFHRCTERPYRKRPTSSKNRCGSDAETCPTPTRGVPGAGRWPHRDHFKLTTARSRFFAHRQRNRQPP